MAEQFRLDQRFGQGGAVHDDQRLVPARRQAVEALRDQFLAGPALPDDQDRPVEFGGSSGLLDRVQKGQRLADELGIFLHAQLMVKFPTFRQELFLNDRKKPRVSAISKNWHGFCKAGTRSR